MSHSKLYAEVMIGSTRELTFKVEIPDGLDAQANENYLQGVENTLLAIKHSKMTSAPAILDTIRSYELLSDLDTLKNLDK